VKRTGATHSPVLLSCIDQLGMQFEHIGLLGRAATLLQIQAQRGKQLGRGELAQVIYLAGVIGACRRMKIILAMRSKPAASNPAGAAAKGAAAAGAAAAITDCP